MAEFFSKPLSEGERRAIPPGNVDTRMTSNEAFDPAGSQAGTNAAMGRDGGHCARPLF
jgi:hypothetical protein